MTNEEAIDIESSQRQHQQCMEHQERMCVLSEATDYHLFSIVKPKVFMDGDQWCVLYGENIQDGVAGFGDSAHDAVLDWNKNWNKANR